MSRDSFRCSKQNHIIFPIRRLSERIWIKQSNAAAAAQRSIGFGWFNVWIISVQAHLFRLSSFNGETCFVSARVFNDKTIAVSIFICIASCRASLDCLIKSIKCWNSFKRCLLIYVDEFLIGKNPNCVKPLILFNEDDLDANTIINYDNENER
jgi:hypothetical protein